MRVQIPQSDRHSTVRLSVSTPKGELKIESSTSNRELTIELPVGVSADEVSVTAVFLNGAQQVDPAFAPVLLKERVAKPAPKVEAPKPAPKVEAPKSEPKPETKPIEPKAEPKAE